MSTTAFSVKSAPLFLKSKEERRRSKIRKYESKLTVLWTWLFWAFALQVSSNKLSFGRKLIAVSLFLIQLCIALHFVVAIFNTVVIVNEIRTLSLFLTVLFCDSLCVSFWSLLTYRKERIVAMQSKLSKIISHDVGWARSVWREAVIRLIGLNFLTIVSFVISASDLALADPETLRYYVHLYIIGFDLNYDQLQPTKIFIMSEFSMSVAVSMSFLNITVTFFAHLCKLLSLNFKLFNRKVESILEYNRRLDITQLVYYRHRHQELCIVAEQLSDLFSPVIVLWILTFIITLCFQLRGLTFLKSTKLVVGLGLDALKYAWLLLIVFKDAAEVNKQAHVVGEKIVTMPIPVIADEFQQSQYNVNYLLFNQRLLNTRVGVNASELFLLNTASFLSMTGTVVTYAIVLYQTS